MKVITTKMLNLREGGPRRDAPLKGTINPGFTLEVEPTEGEPIDGNSLWYMDKNGDFLWSGGVRRVGEQRDDETTQRSVFLDYNRDVKSRFQALQPAKGTGVKIAVLDTGIYRNHPDFGGAFKTPDQVQDFTGNQESGAEDRKGHGTHCAGLIGARNTDDVGITGLAPECELYCLKVAADDGSFEIAAIKQALVWLKNQDIRVINMSFRLSPTSYAEIKVDLADLAGQGKIMVAPAGKDTLLTDEFSSEFLYPAMDENVLAVGAISKPVLDDANEVRFLPELDIMVPLLKMESTFLKRTLYEKLAGSSQACAYVAGLIVRMLSSASGKPELSQVREALRQASKRYRNEDVPFTNIALINPEEAS